MCFVATFWLHVVYLNDDSPLHPDIEYLWMLWIDANVDSTNRLDYHIRLIKLPIRQPVT